MALNNFQYIQVPIIDNGQQSPEVKSFLNLQNVHYIKYTVEGATHKLTYKLEFPSVENISILIPEDSCIQFLFAVVKPKHTAPHFDEWTTLED